MLVKPISQLLNRIPKRLYQVAFLLAIATISYLAFSPAKDQPSLFLISDKLNHLAAFFTLSLLLDYALPNLKTPFKFSILFGYGIFIELVQAQIPHREFSYLDLLTDAIGCFCYYGFSLYILKPNSTQQKV